MDCTIIRGPNGAGKTGALLEYLTNTSVKGAGYLDQGNPRCVYGTTVLGNLLAPLVFGGYDLARAHEIANERLRSLGQERLLGREYRRLSGGERQTVAFLSATLGEPELLLLDAPVAMLDPGRRQGLVQVINRYLSRDTPQEVVLTELSGREELSVCSNDNCRKEIGPQLDFTNEIDDLITELASHASRGECQLELRDVQVSVPGQTLVRNGTVTLNGGGVTLFTGRNGSGKSQLLAAIAAARGMDLGRVRITTARHGSAREIPARQGVRLVPQFPDSLLLLSPVGACLDRAKGISPALVLTIERLRGTFLDIAVQPQCMSPGERRFAACFVSSVAAFLDENVCVIAFDEPDAGLDGARCRFLAACISKFAEATGKVVLIATHAPERYAENVIRRICIEDHSLVESGQDRAEEEVGGDHQVDEQAGLSPAAPEDAKMYVRLAMAVLLVAGSVVGTVVGTPVLVNLGVPVLLIALGLIRLDKVKAVLLLLCAIPVGVAVVTAWLRGSDVAVFPERYSAVLLYLAAIAFAYDAFAIHEGIHLARTIAGKRAGRHISIVLMASAVGLNTLRDSNLSWKVARQLSGHRHWSGIGRIENLLESIASLVIAVAEAAQVMSQQVKCWRKRLPVTETS